MPSVPTDRCVNVEGAARHGAAGAPTANVGLNPGPWAAWTRGIVEAPVAPELYGTRDAADPRLPIQGLTPERLAAETGAALPSVRKMVASVQQRGATVVEAPRQPIPRLDRRLIGESYRVGRLHVVERVVSQVDPFIKYLFESEDGARFEAVRIPLLHQGRFSVCVSSQVGCAFGCRYCATGTIGLIRSLQAWEIVEQVRCVRRELPAGTRIHGVVFQGMGEPLANLEPVLAAVDVLSHPCGQSIDQRAITITTAGLPKGIRQIAQLNYRVRLGISVGSARLDSRRHLMPIESHHSLPEVLLAATEHALRTGYAPMLAVTLLSGINCFPEDAVALREQALEFRARSGMAPRISLIPYNPAAADDPFHPATPTEVEAFRQVLAEAGLPVVRRYSGGADVGAACGQLVASPGKPEATLP